LKIAMIFSIAGAGVVLALRERGGYFFGAKPLEARPVKRTEAGTERIWNEVGEYVTAGLAALWVYGGWESVSPHSPSPDLLQRTSADGTPMRKAWLHRRRNA